MSRRPSTHSPWRAVMVLQASGSVPGNSFLDISLPVHGWVQGERAAYAVWQAFFLQSNPQQSNLIRHMGLHSQLCQC